MISLPPIDADERTAIYGSGWRSLCPFDLILLETIAESDSDFGLLAVDLAKEAKTDSQRTIAECVACLADWVRR